jgi:hypothetical protein
MAEVPKEILKLKIKKASPTTAAIEEANYEFPQKSVFY